MRVEGSRLRVSGVGIRDGPSGDAATRVVPLRDDPRLVELHSVSGFKVQGFGLSFKG